LNQRRAKEKEARLASAPLPRTTRQSGSFVPAKREVPKVPGTFTGNSATFVPLQRPGGSLVRQPGVLPIVPAQPIKCFNCGETGHISKECTKPRGNINDIEEDEPEFEEDSGKDDA
jgi:hypothetical protein